MVVLHIVVIIIGLSFITYRIYTNSFYARYNKQMESILTYAQSHIDDDDMSECARTYIESEKYRETQAFFDNFVDNYTDLHYLYIVKIFFLEILHFLVVLYFLYLILNPKNLLGQFLGHIYLNNQKYIPAAHASIALRRNWPDLRKLLTCALI